MAGLALGLAAAVLERRVPALVDLPRIVRPPPPPPYTMSIRPSGSRVDCCTR